MSENFKNSFFKIIFTFFLASISSSLSFAQQALEGSIFDNFGRLVSYPGKLEVTCPVQNENMAGILAIGQSNASNAGEKKFVTKYPDKVFNYFNGKCFVASSPLLGATADQGEFITPLADKLIENGAYESVLIISSAIGGSAIKYWEQGGYLNNMLLSVLAEVSPKYRITEIIWHQGESDYSVTTAAQYIKSFNSLTYTIRRDTVAPTIYYAIATYCAEGNWTPENSVAEAQRSLENESARIFLGADTDSLLLSEDRAADHCHFSETGQLKTAYSFAEAIRQHKLGGSS